MEPASKEHSRGAEKEPIEASIFAKNEQCALSRPHDHGIQIPTIGTNTLDCSDRSSFHTRTSVTVLIVLADQDLRGIRLAEHHADLVHIVHILLKNYRVVQDLCDYVQPL